ncbi:MAG: hypothetical protein QM405_03730 [Euryarchaeota archaeon]|nr:hypothetical protein [Euryarchaeota archaeon]
MRKITLFIFIIWIAIGMSVAALYIPVSSDQVEAQRPIFEQENLLCPQNDISPLTSPINSTLINRTNVDLSLDVLSPIVALVQVQLNSLTGNGPFVSLIQVKLEPTVIITDKVVTTDKPLETKTTVELPKDEVKTKSMVTNTINTTLIGTNTTVIETNTTETNTTETNTTDLGAGSKYLVENLSFINTQFTVEITNQNNNVISGGFYEISTDPSSNHANVLQSGTFPYAPGTFTISNVLTFTPADNIRYYILVYTNYPESDNRVSKDNAIFTYSDMVS